MEAQLEERLSPGPDNWDTVLLFPGVRAEAPKEEREWTEDRGWQEFWEKIG